MKKIITLCLLAFIGTTTLNAQCFKKVAASGAYSVAIKTDGTLWACGNNQYGQFGNGTMTPIPTTTFTQIGTATDWADIFCCSSNGNHTLGLKTDGTLWAWGLNSNGQLGINNTTNQLSPVQVSLPSGKMVKSISLGGAYSLALMTDGTAYSWGNNSYGQLGIGFSLSTMIPIPVSLPIGKIAASIAAGASHALAIMTDGTIYAWGQNSSGQLGDGTTTTRFGPVKVGLPFPASIVTAGSSNTYAIMTGGTLWAWGKNTYGQLGIGNTINQSTPTQVTLPIGKSIRNVIAGFDHALATMTDESLYSWGWNSNGQLGIGTTTNQTTPMLVSNISVSSNNGSVGASIHSIVITPNGRVYSWGSNTRGQLGCGNTTDQTSPLKISLGGCSACTPTTGTFTISACNSYTWAAKGNQVYTASNNTDTIHLTNAGGCDSLVTLDLTIKTTSSSSNNIAICTSALPYSWNGLTFNAAGTQTKSGFTNAAGCDSSATLTVTVKAVTSSSNSIAICSSALPYSWNGLTFNAAGTQTKTGFTNAAGCDSSATLTLSVSNTTSSITTVLNCGSYTWNGTVYTTSGSYNKLFTGIGGCDSIATLNLTVVSTLPAITGASAVCAGSTTNLSNAISGGVWFTQATSQATINAATGLLTAKNAGTISIQYSKAGCGSVTKSLVINAIPAVPTIAYAPGTPNPQKGAPTSGFCVGKTFTVVGAPSVPAGAWSATGSTNITTGGVVSVVGTGAGTIKYTYTNAAGCSNSRTMSGTGYTCASRGVNTVDDQLATVNDFTMYPNPAKGSVNLNIETLVGAGSIIVTDLYGKTVKTQALSMGTNTVSISNLSKGMYFVSTITNEGKTTKKLVVE